MYYDENEKYPLRDGKTRRIPIGLFIGLFYCPYEQFITEKDFLGKMYVRWTPVINALSQATNQYFLETVIEQYRHQGVFERELGQLSHDLRNMFGLEHERQNDVGSLQQVIDCIRRRIDKLTAVSKTSRNFTLHEIIERLRASACVLDKENYEIISDMENLQQYNLYGYFDLILDVLEIRLNDAVKKAATNNGRAILKISLTSLNGKHYVQFDIWNPGQLPHDAEEFLFNGTSYFSSNDSARPAQGIPFCKDIIERLSDGFFEYSNDNGVSFKIKLPVWESK